MLTYLLSKLVRPSAILVLGSAIALGVALWNGVPQIDVTVGAGLVPAISWTRPVEMSGIRVHQGIYTPDMPFDSDEVMWWIESVDGEQKFLPPIHYGAQVPGTRTIQPPRDLVSGATYTVFLFHADQSFSGDHNIHEVVESFTVRE